VSVVLDKVADMNHFIPLRLMGVRIVMCPHLGRDSVYVPHYQLLVIDADLSDQRCEEIACDVLGLAVHRLAA
jgi:hypothetical protein